MMAQFNLHPGDIYWDGSVHRFSTPDKPRREDGWLMAFPDRRGAIFGDHARGIREHWMADRSEDPTPSDRARWAADREARREQQEKAQKAAIETAQALWKDAIKDEETVLKNPYLKRKEIDHDVAGQLRVTREAVEFSKGWKLPKGTLLVPMRINRKLVNVQCILADGRKRFWPKAPVIGAAHMVGGKFWNAEEKDRRVYVTEGWATAWSISKATNRPVIVCFSTGGIEPVTKRFMKKHKTAEFIIAADNDRWKVLKQREGHDDIPNPGVHHAKQAAKRLKVKYSVPDFNNLTDKPTDYDDLRRQEGEDSVRHWLHPRNAKHAHTTPPEVREGDEDEGPVEPAWVDDAPFRCLGYHNREYYFLDQGGQLMSVPGLGFGSRGMLMLAPEGFWNTYFDSKQGIRWQSAASSVLHHQATRKGVFKPGMIRGRGIWRNEDLKIVAHLGDRLLPPDVRRYIPPENYADGDTIYHRLPRLSGPSSTKPMPLEDRKRLYEMFASRFWHHDGSGPLLLGFTVLAPFCAALDWRPHIWIIGTKGCGKTKVIELMILPLMGDMVLAGQGRTTEAGIRQTLGHDALPVVCDEMEGTSPGARGAVRGILELARSASSPTGQVIKGTQHGKSLRFQVRSSFLLASISSGLTEPSDQSRFCVLPLKGSNEIDPELRRKDWIDFRRKLKRHVHRVAGRQLIAATLKAFRSGHMDELLHVCKSSADQVFRDARMGDQMGTLAAGAWLCQSDEIPSENEVTDWLGSLSFAGMDWQGEEESKGLVVLNKLLQARESVRVDGQMHSLTVGSLIAIATGRTLTGDQTVKAEDADRALRQIGFRIAPNGNGILIANTSEWVKQKLAKTPYHAGFIRVLRSIPGAEKRNATNFHSRQKSSRATFIPMAALK